MLEFHTLDGFTQTPFRGNPLAVVLGADDLATAQMQTIARGFNLSKTIFALAPQDPRHTRGSCNRLSRRHSCRPVAGQRLPHTPGTNHLTLHQGVEMSRASTLHLTTHLTGTLRQIRVSGSVVPSIPAPHRHSVMPLGNSLHGL